MNTNKSKMKSYLTFSLGEEIFAANVVSIQNILEMSAITKIPDVPGYMKGVVNLRGSILPVIDTRLKLEMEETAITSNTCILVLELRTTGEVVKVGALVDAVLEVKEIDDEQIQPLTPLASLSRLDVIEGMVQNGESFIMLLNVDRLFALEEVAMISEI